MNSFIFSEIFFNIEKMLDFLVEKEVLTEEIDCSSCRNKMRLQIRKKQLIYRCIFRNCRQRKTLCRNSLGLCKYLHIIYLILTECNYKQLNRYYNLTNTTIFRMKKLLRKIFKKHMQNNKTFLGGLGKVIEIDETVLSRRQIIKNPTSLEDDVLDTVWILGAIDNTPEKNFFIKRVENRKVETLTRELEDKLKIGSIICTDGFSSYPQTCENLGLEHKIVNHSEGFVAPDGTHTNNIEGFWSHLKSQMRKENGVKRENLDSWLIEYEFKRRFLMKADNYEIYEIYLKILKILFYDDILSN